MISCRSSMWMRFVGIVVFTALVPMVGTQSVAAQTGIIVTPVTQTVTAFAGSTATATITIRNNTSVDRIITLAVSNLPMAGGTYSAAFSADGFVLSSGMEKTIPVIFVTPSGAIPGTYTNIQISVTAQPIAGQSGTIAVTNLTNLTVVDSSLPVRVRLPLVLRAQ